MFSLVALSRQPYFITISRSYIFYELNSHHNKSYFNTYCLDWFLPTKQKKTSDPDFYQDRIVQLSGILRLFILIYEQTLRKIFLCSYFPFAFHLYAPPNTLLTFMIFLIIKQHNVP